MGVNETGHEHLAGNVDLGGSGGNRGLGCGAHGEDLTVLDDQHAIFDGIARDGQNLRSDIGGGRRLGESRQRGEDKGRAKSCF